MRGTTKITLLLPICQTAVACALLILGRHEQFLQRVDTSYSPTATSICFGVNAPAVLVRPFIALLLPLVRVPFPEWADQLALDEIPFLLIVAGLWYFVARWLVALRRPGRDLMQRNPTLTITTYVVTIIVGAILFYLGVGNFLHLGRWNNPLGNAIEGSFCLLWALALLTVSFKNLIGLLAKGVIWRRG